jgi:hypothetical protein
MIFTGLAALATFGMFVLIFVEGRRVEIIEFCGQLIVFGIALYVSLCELLLAGLARTLTRWRGEKWVKEMDYVYLFLGIIGVLGSVNRLDAINGRYAQADVLGPMVLTAAIVVRLIKTRADIAGWNKS